jgi:hypothetical protein
VTKGKLDPWSRGRRAEGARRGDRASHARRRSGAAAAGAAAPGAAPAADAKPARRRAATRRNPARTTRRSRAEVSAHCRRFGTRPAVRNPAGLFVERRPRGGPP